MLAPIKAWTKKLIHYKIPTAIVLAVFIAMQCPSVAAQTVEEDSTQPPLQITAGPYLQAPSENGVTIVWATNRKCVSKVEYWTAPEAPVKIAVSSRHGLIDANNTLHRIRLDDLKPGTTYHYRVVSTEILDFQAYKVVYGETIKGRAEKFTALDAGKERFSFIVLNDRHEKVDLLTQSLKSISWDGVDLVVLNGDMLDYVVGEEQIFKSIIRPCESVFAGRIPFVLVRGNHDARGSFARMLMDYFPTPNGRYYYAFSHGGVRFVVLDSGEDKADSDKEYAGLVQFGPYLYEETKWLKEEIRGEPFKTARFRVVLVHIPLLSGKSSRFNQSQSLLDRWGQQLNEGKIDLMLSGHTHRYAEFPPTKDKNQYTILVNGTDTTVRVDVNGDRMSVSTFNNDGSAKSKLPDIIKK
jgi:acid phosphatase type 7